jgi:hypothetical protein
MHTPSTRYRLYPPIGACLRWSLTLMFWLLIVVIGFSLFKQWGWGQPFPQTLISRSGNFIAFSAGLGFLLGLCIFGMGWVWAATFGPETLRATNLWGRMTDVPYSSIATVRAGSIQGLPVLIIQSSASRSGLYIYTLGLDRELVYSQLYTLAGPDNPLTQAFKPSAMS